jgi:hypothetical protein
MAYASITYTSASGTTFALTNSEGDPITYLRQNDISVYVNDVLKTVTTDYTFNTAGTAIVLNTSVSGVTVRIERITAIAAATVTYTAGSTLTAQDLNNADNQIRFGLQEFSDTYAALNSGTGDLGNLGGVIDSNEAWSSDDSHLATTAAISNRTWNNTTQTLAIGETWQDSDSYIATAGAIDDRIDTKVAAGLVNDVVAGTDLSITDNSPTSGKITINHNVTGANVNVNNGNGTVLQDITVTAQGHVTAVGSYDLDNRYYTETEADAKYWNNTTQTIDSGETWVSNNTTIATTGAINARVIDLIDEVGGFFPIANEDSFPTYNPDPKDSTGTIVSITDVGGMTYNTGTGVSTDAQTTAASTVTITGIPTSLSSPFAVGLGMLVETTATLNTYTFVRLVPIAGDVTTVANIQANVTTVAGISANVTTVAGISGNVTTVATNNSNVTTVAGSISNVNTVATNISNVNTTATNIGNVNAVAGNSTNINAAVSNTANINTVASNNTSINTVADISGNVTTVAGISADVTTVATNVTNVNTVSTNISNVNAVAGNSTNINAVAGNSTNINAVAGNSTNINTVATNNSNVTAVSTNISNVNAVASNQANIDTAASYLNNFFALYLGNQTSDPNLDALGNGVTTGDLYFNTNSSQTRVFNGSSWQSIVENAFASFTPAIEDFSALYTGSVGTNTIDLGLLQITGGVFPDENTPANRVALSLGALSYNLGNL